MKQLKLLLSVVAVLGLASCSHRTPYLRDGPSPASPEPGTGTPAARLVLVGDAGESDAPVLDDVRSWASEYPDRTAVLFLGDNFYPVGMTPARRDEADTKLLPQIEAATSAGARALFIPGNHDWADGGEMGYDAILAQAAYIGDRLPHPEGFLPAGGCPGPVAIDSLPSVRIVAIDTQWFLHESSKPIEACPYPDTARFASALSELLDTDRTVVIAAHHPLIGFGRHSGLSDWREHLLPPIVGSLIALKRKLLPRSQDFHSEPYRSMTALFRSAITASEEHSNLVIWASGHEHSLQVLEGQAADYILISGSAANTTPVRDGPETLFAHSHPGFMVIDLMESGEAWLRVIEPETGEMFLQGLERRTGTH